MTRPARDITQRQQAILAQMKKPAKYRNRKTVVGNICFDSAKEAKRYQELRLLEKVGEIFGLELQPEFTLCAPDNHWNISAGLNGHPVVGKYRGDFFYKTRSGEQIVEDVKGFKTPLYRWKKKHVEAQYGIKILET